MKGVTGSRLPLTHIRYGSDAGGARDDRAVSNLQQKMAIDGSLKRKDGSDRASPTMSQEQTLPLAVFPGSTLLGRVRDESRRHSC